MENMVSVTTRGPHGFYILTLFFFILDHCLLIIYADLWEPWVQFVCFFFSFLKFFSGKVNLERYLNRSFIERRNIKRGGLEFDHRIYSLLLSHVHLCKALLSAKTREGEGERELNLRRYLVLFFYAAKYFQIGSEPNSKPSLPFQLRPNRRHTKNSFAVNISKQSIE